MTLTTIAPRLRSAFWVVPTLCALRAGVLAPVVARLDEGVRRHIATRELAVGDRVVDGVLRLRVRSPSWSTAPATDLSCVRG